MLEQPISSDVFDYFPITYKEVICETFEIYVLKRQNKYMVYNMKSRTIGLSKRPKHSITKLTSTPVDILSTLAYILQLK